MNFTKTNINGLFVIEINPFNDIRGQLFKPFTSSFYSSNIGNSININIKEVWFTKSKLNVIRAMHLQTGEFACEKIVSIICGTVHDVVLDIRKESATYGNIFDVELSEKSPKALYIPIGCAHGYRVLSENSIVMYMATQEHSAKDDTGIRYDSFGFDWGIENPIISERDANLPLFSIN
ncbi:MAG: dTDP-4-dehydrorhamnose 3,5-epimerase family protein [Prevotellaceae bacterium]|jgi:dTDP-4-dehydrorhamnose 3,5-epimerase/CDP-3, 6-dideoxy-D-glycero-D-glycero-4-hexulose-5-epimerase|nr:dTDP-4-dehydrorhamnose 3,5-epimerase family protein [Prevotellaceae bacterium]